MNIDFAVLELEEWMEGPVNCEMWKCVTLKMQWKLRIDVAAFALLCEEGSGLQSHVGKAALGVYFVKAEHSIQP